MDNNPFGAEVDPFQKSIFTAKYHTAKTLQKSLSENLANANDPEVTNTLDAVAELIINHPFFVLPPTKNFRPLNSRYADAV